MGIWRFISNIFILFYLFYFILFNLVVCYAGLDTKLMKNINKASFKRSHMDKLLDKIIIGVNLFYFI